MCGQPEWLGRSISRQRRLSLTWRAKRGRHVHADGRSDLKLSCNREISGWSGDGNKRACGEAAYVNDWSKRN